MKSNNQGYRNQEKSQQQSKYTYVDRSAKPGSTAKQKVLFWYMIVAVTVFALTLMLFIGVQIGKKGKNASSVSASEQTFAPNETTTMPIPTQAQTPEPTTQPTPEPTPLPTPEPTLEPTPKIVPSKDDIQALIEKNENNRIQFPKDSSYLSDYETMYVKSGRGHSIYLYFAPTGYEEHRRSHYVYEGWEVTVLAREGNFSCIIYSGEDGTQFCGWVYSKYLVYEK